jgi:hypothetical protein
MGQVGDSSTTIYLPLATDVVVKGFTNAADIQRITVTPSGGNPSVFQGTGEQNTPIGSMHFTTPASGEQPSVAIKIEYSGDGGNTWQPSDIFTDSCSIEAYQLVVVVSEDHVDEDYNDAVCIISWPEAVS